MKEKDYHKLQRQLNTYEDVNRIAKERGIDWELLFVAYTQHVVRDATKRFYKIKRDSHKLLGEWKRGKTLLEIANVNHFPPVLMSQMILLSSGVGRKTFWSWVRGQAPIPDPRLKKELEEVVAHDHIYSPEGGHAQTIRGLRGERRLEIWLESKGCKYKTEEDLRGETQKTPDCLLEKPITIQGQKINWIESKANFGDSNELRKNLTRQLIPYTKLFGPGAVVYWLGYVEDHGNETEGVLILDGKELTGTPGLEGVPKEMVHPDLD